MVSLTKSYIFCYSQKLNVEKITFSCKHFPNFPLIGSKGCINYGPTLALIQLSYHMLEKPTDEMLKSFVFHYICVNNPIVLQKIIQSWDKVHKKEVSWERKFV